MIDGVPFKLFDSNSGYPDSEIFYLNPGYHAIVRSYGFYGGNVTPVAGSFATKQQACLKQIYRTFKKEELDGACGVFPSIPSFGLDEYHEEVVISNGCEWHLSACQTVGVISLPGLYRLSLNDAAAVGNVHIYLTAYPLQMLVNSYFFGV
jgi:hypothetical protein